MRTGMRRGMATPATMTEGAMEGLENKYRATTVTLCQWNEVVRAFCREMPRRRHRRQFRSFEGTFTGAEALDWLHAHLAQRPDYKENRVSRAQALALLNKFFDQAILSAVKRDGERRPDEVRDDATLFRMVDASPSKLTRTPLALKTRSGLRPSNEPALPQPDLPRKLRSAVTPLKYRRLPASPMVPRVDHDPSPKNRRAPLYKTPLGAASTAGKPRKGPRLAQRSASLQGRRSPEPVEDKGDLLDLRDFLRSQEPEPIEAKEDASPSAPSLVLLSRPLAAEDLDRLWRDEALRLLSTLTGGEVALPPTLQSAPVETVRWAQTQRTDKGVTKARNEGEAVPLKLLRPMRALMKHPYAASSQQPRLQDFLSELVSGLRSSGTPVLASAEVAWLLQLLNRAEYLDVQSWDAQGGPSFAEISSSVSSRSRRGEEGSLERAIAVIEEASRKLEVSGVSGSSVGPRYETEFSEVEPVTRLLGEPCMTAPRSRASYALSKASEGSPFQRFFTAMSGEAVEVVSASPEEQKAPRLSFADLLSDLASDGSKDSPLDVERKVLGLPGIRDSPTLRLRIQAQAGASRAQSRLAQPEFEATSDCGSAAANPFKPPRPPRLGLPPVPTFPGQARPSRLRASWAPNTRHAAALMQTPGCLSERAQSNEALAFTPLQLHACNSMGSVNFFTASGEAAAVEVLRLALLFLHTRTRIWLKTLLKFMRRCSLNVHLDSALGLNRYRLLELFLGSLMPASAGPVSGQLKLATFLMDNEEALFRPSIRLANVLKAAVAATQEAKLSSVPAREVRYCDWVPRAAYAEIGRSYSQNAIDGLLNSLVEDERSSPKSRRRRLQKFRKEYPAAFNSRFPSAASFEALFPPPKRRFPVFLRR